MCYNLTFSFTDYNLLLLQKFLKRVPSGFLPTLPPTVPPCRGGPGAVPESLGDPRRDRRTLRPTGILIRPLRLWIRQLWRGGCTSYSQTFGQKKKCQKNVGWDKTSVPTKLCCTSYSQNFWAEKKNVKKILVPTSNSVEHELGTFWAPTMTRPGARGGSSLLSSAALLLVGYGGWDLIRAVTCATSPSLPPSFSSSVAGWDRGFVPNQIF